MKPLFDVERSGNVVKNLAPWVLLWAVCLSIYGHLIQSSATLPIAEHFVYFMQMFADVFTFAMSIVAFCKQQDRLAKRFFFAMLLCIIVGMCSNEIYNVLVNVFNIQFSASWNEFWILMYTVFLIIQILSWLCVFLEKMREDKSPHEALLQIPPLNIKTHWLLRLPILQSAILIFLSICITGIFKDSIYSKMVFSQLANSILEVLLFIVISLCLARLKNRSLIYLAAGFLFLVTFNLVHRLAYMLNMDAKLFDMAWLLSFIPIIYGFFQGAKNPEPIQFFEENSIHVIVGAIFLAFTGFLFVIFTGLELFFAFLQKRSLWEMFSVLDNTSGVLLFTFMLSVLVGKTVASYWSAPVEAMMRRIHQAQKSPEELQKLPAPHFAALEAQVLDAFIMKSIGDLQIANQVKENFLMNMSHDLRTPASSIYNLTKWVNTHLEDEKLKPSQDYAVKSSEQLLHLINDILDFSRLSSKKFIPLISEVSIEKLITNVVALMRPGAQEKQLEIKDCVERDLYFFTDDSALFRILVNLVGNAIKFTNEGIVLITAEKEEGVLKIRVQDSGIGIDSKDHARIFESFTQIERSPQNPGVGLGLSNIKSTLEILGGNIFLKSELGQGALFEITLYPKNP